METELLVGGGSEAGGVGGSLHIIWQIVMYDKAVASESRGGGCGCRVVL